VALVFWSAPKATVPSRESSGSNGTAAAADPNAFSAARRETRVDIYFDTS
jgi:hypothetical protein